MAEYSKRLTPYCKLEIVELKESRLRQNAGPAEEDEVKINEGREILEKIASSDYVITLEIKGKRLSSEKLADKLAELALSVLPEEEKEYLNNVRAFWGIS